MKSILFIAAAFAASTWSTPIQAGPRQESVVLARSMDFVKRVVIPANTPANPSIRDKLVYVHELRVGGEKAFAISFWDRLPSECNAYVRISDGDPVIIHDVRARMNLSSNDRLYYIQQIIRPQQLVVASDYVHPCTKVYTGGLVERQYDTYCVDNYMVPELAKYEGQYVTVELRSSGVGNAPCDLLSLIAHPFACRLEGNDFIREVSKDGDVLERFYSDRFTF